MPILDRKTLEGLIDQIFDKALTETGFCEMYASVSATAGGLHLEEVELHVPWLGLHWDGMCQFEITDAS